MEADKKYEVEQMKEGGNRYYEKKEYGQAVNIYGQAIERDPQNAVLYSNRAMGMKSNYFVSQLHFIILFSNFSLFEVE